MAVEWGETDPPIGSVPPQRNVAPSSWPTRVGGYIKLILTAVTTLGTTGVLAWLQAAGVTSLPAWATAGITAVVGLLTLLLSPKNKV